MRNALHAADAHLGWNSLHRRRTCAGRFFRTGLDHRPKSWNASGAYRDCL